MNDVIFVLFSLLSLSFESEEGKKVAKKKR